MKKKLHLLIIFFIFSILLYAQTSSVVSEVSERPGTSRENPIKIETSKLPLLQTLSSYNDMFKEYSKIVEYNHKALISGREPQYFFYNYKNTEKFTLQWLASRTNIPYDTISVLNGIESSSTDIKGKNLILPVVPGIFVPLFNASTQIEVILQEKYDNEVYLSPKSDNPTLTKNFLYFNIDGRDYLFLVNERFSPTERAYFLNSALQLPINTDDFYISSEFGKRKNPFSGEMKDHNGIDFAAAEGTPVYAIKDGAAYCCIQNDPVFGNYIILSQKKGKMTSVYAHLSKMVIEQYQRVKKGDLIGYVGQTGQATGPHLHFEIREGGKAENPRDKLDLRNK